MINTEIQAINIGTTQASALYIGTNLIWSATTPLPANMERHEFIPADIYDDPSSYNQYGQLQPIDVTIQRARVYSQDGSTHVYNDGFYVPNTQPLQYLRVTTTQSTYYVYSVEIEFAFGTEEYLGSNGNSFAYDQQGTYTLSGNKLTWEWDSSIPTRVVDFYNVADPNVYGDVDMEISKITVVVAGKTVTSLNDPIITSVSNGDGTAEVTITSGNNVNTDIYYSLDGSNYSTYTQALTINEGDTVYAFESYTEYPFNTSVTSSTATYTVPINVSPASAGEYVFNCADDTPIADRQQYTVRRGNVSMTVSDGLIYLDQHYRIYAAQDITFDAGGSTMSHIDFDFINNYSNNSSTVLTADSGTCANNYSVDLTGEWNGSATSVTIHTSKQIRVSEFRVTVD